MSTLRRHTLTARLVLAWFVWVLGVSIATPLLQSGASANSLGAVCTSMGMAQMPVAPQDTGDGDAPPAHSLGMGCPLCVLLAPPTPAVALPAHYPSAQERPWHAAAAARPAQRMLSLPPRGPPRAA